MRHLAEVIHPLVRKSRDQARRILEAGKDPAIEKKTEKLQFKLEQQAQLIILEHQAARVTVRELFQRWASLVLAKRKDGGKEVMRGLEKDVLPLIGDMAAEDVGKAHVTRILDAILSRGANRLANRTLSELRHMFGFGYTRDIVKSDPTYGIKKRDIGGKEVERDRVLSEPEIRELASKIESANMHKPTEYAVWIMLSTCCRVGEISKARWEHADFDSRTWTIPEENSKNAKALTVYLSDFALRQFEGLLALKDSEDWIFPARGGLSHVCLKSITKQVGDRQRTEALKNRSKLTGSLLLSGGSWTPHDLRRTGATLMGGVLRVPSDVVKRCLNHTEKNKVKRIYQRQELKAEQAEAWRLLGARLDLLTRQDCGDVVNLPSRAA